MKKLLLFLALTAMGATSIAQVCTPDPQYTTAGIYPDSATNLPLACLNEIYNVVVTAVVPYDTTAQTPFGPATVTFDSINIKKTNNIFQVTGLPPNFTFACEPPSCSFPGGGAPGQVGKGCLLITGNPTAPTAAGDTFNLAVDLVAYVSNVPIVGTYTLDDGTEDVNYYYIAVKATGTCGSSVNEKNGNPFAVKQNSPNPFSKRTRIEFSNYKTGKVNFTVYNMIGEIVHTEKINSVEGSNNIILFYADNFPAGIYSYSLDNGEKTVSKRMILLEN